MTLATDQSTPLGALYGAVKKYPGGVRQLAADMDIPESTLYAKLRGEKGYPLSYKDDLEEVLQFLRSREVEGWEKSLHVLCRRHDHLAIPIPRSLSQSGGDELKQVSLLMHEVSEIANALAEGVDVRGDGGKEITSTEMKRIEAACDEAMEKIAETRERYRQLHLAAKKKGLVK